MAPRLSHARSLAPEEWAPRIVPEWDELVVSTLELSSYLLRARWCALFLFHGNRESLALARLLEDGAAAPSETLEAPAESLERRVADGSGEPTAALRPTLPWIGAEPAPAGGRGYPVACAAIELGGHRLGMIEAAREAGGDPFHPGDLKSLQIAGRQLALYLRNGALVRRLSRLANTDGLTGTYNYRYFQDQLDLEVERAARYGRSVSLIMLDLNSFKRYNDLLGHQRGDAALRATASAIQRAVRRIDVVARYGGDEFAIILPETDGRQALTVAARIGQAIRDQMVPIPAGALAERLSACMGVSSYPVPAGSKDELIAQADSALYRAKRSRVRTIRMWEARPRPSPRGAQTPPRLI